MNRRAMKKAASDGTVTKEVIKELKKFKKCPYCGDELNDKNTHIDHIHPLSKGGRHTVGNITACCGTCNTRKNNMDFFDWLTYIQ